ncbi:MAG TPA: hypothetical protein VIL24_05490 [Clostridia bacterium]
MENTTIKFKLSKRELFWLSLYSQIKTVLLIAMVAVVLLVIGLLIFAFGRLTPAVNLRSYYANAILLSVYILIAGAAYTLCAVIYYAIKIAVLSKKDPAVFDERLISIEKDRAVITYSDNKKDIIKWGQYKIHLENKKYLFLKSDISGFIIKKDILSPQDLEWLKQNLKEQNHIEYRKTLEAKRKR